MSDFRARVLDVVRNIPRGTTLSYQEVARLAGNSRAYRAVGSIMRRNQDLSVPCHRVVKSDGSAGRYNGLLGRAKSELLQEEQM